MNAVASRLPSGFESLEPFVDQWAQPTTAARAQSRGTSSGKERQAFYDAAKDLLPKAIAYLDRKPLNQFDDGERTLMNLMLALSHVVLAVEVQGPEEGTHRVSRDLMRIMRSPADA